MQVSWKLIIGKVLFPILAPKYAIKTMPDNSSFLSGKLTKNEDTLSLRPSESKYCPD